MNIVKYRKIYFFFSFLVILSSIVVLFLFGLKAGIDFTGGSILELEYIEERPKNEKILADLEGIDIGTVTIQPVDQKGVILRMRDISEENHQEILLALEGAEEKRFESIGPVIGRELKEKTRIVVVLALFSMIAYIALAFRRVQKPVKSWEYGIISVFALFHDLLIPLAVFSVLGELYLVEISIPVITAFLAVLGYSINNTVVVFDRIRENIFRRDLSFEEIVNKSISQTLTRQINTSLTTLFVALSIFFFGGETLKYFALVLVIGITAGTYSSIFLAGPILVSWYKRKMRKA